jgi:hypothetical protein
MYGSKAPQGAHYYCRGCGEKLPPDWHGQFHPECLKADKRRRTQDERAKLLARLEGQKCPTCGATLGREPKPRRREASLAAPGRSGPRAA